jgi:hypothetical protein
MRVTIIPALLLVLSLTGCLESPADLTPASTAVSPALQASARSNGFMPLTVGNHWSYDLSITTVMIPDDGPPPPPVTMSERVDLYQSYTFVFDDVEYIVEQEHYEQSPVLREWLRRQDRAGYYILETAEPGAKAERGPMLSGAGREYAAHVADRYGLDRAAVEVQLQRLETLRRVMRGLELSASPPGGAGEWEITTLAYPLHPGATWTVRDQPLVVATVEERENFSGFSAWRVRIDSELMGENDIAHFWYSRCGQLGSRLHLEATAVDESGHSTGKLISDDFFHIIDAEIDRNGCDVDAAGGGEDGHGSAVNSYPLAEGNRWTYEITTTLDGQSVGPADVVDDVQQEWVNQNGARYMKQVMESRGPQTWTAVAYLRQDRDGLYRLDPPASPEPSGRLPVRLLSGAPGENEALVLPYPLKIGESWTIRDTPQGGLWTATVEARDVIDSPAGAFRAFRVRVSNEFQGPGDDAMLWYGADGLIKASEHVQTDDGLVDTSWELIELDLR